MRKKSYEQIRLAWVWVLSIGYCTYIHVGEMGQIIGETGAGETGVGKMGVGETGVDETGIPHIFIITYYDYHHNIMHGSRQFTGDRGSSFRAG